MTEKNKRAAALKEQAGEVFTAHRAREAGVHGQLLKKFVDEGVIYKIDRGLYSFDEYWDDELHILQYRFKKGIFSNETALFLHGYSDRAPFEYDMTFPQDVI